MGVFEFVNMFYFLVVFTQEKYYVNIGFNQEFYEYNILGKLLELCILQYQRFQDFQKNIVRNFVFWQNWECVEEFLNVQE